jgi:hypothetical protein
MLRQRLIDSMCSMSDEFHGNATTPDWLLKLHGSASTATLIERMSNWRHHHPELFAKHGVYVL